MKKISSYILIVFGLFSIANTNAYLEINNQGAIDKLMDFPFGIQEAEFDLKEITYVYFKNKDTQTQYDNFRTLGDEVKVELMKLYREGSLDYYQMNGIVDEFNSYVYDANKMFSYMKMKETRNDKQLNNIILNHYEGARQHYETLKHLIANYPKQKEVKKYTCPVSRSDDCVYFPRDGHWYRYY